MYKSKMSLAQREDPDERVDRFQQTNYSSSYKETSTYNALEVLGSGSFGVVYKAECIETKEIVAIKKVLQDKRYKNRELQIMKELDHPNVIKTLHSFYTPAENDDLYLNVVMDYVSDTLARVIRNYYKSSTQMEMLLVKIYAYQLLKSINYIHALGICHRDIKPHNILIDRKTNCLKLCDFGSAKKLVKGDSNVSYICSRYYRAPELIFAAEEYSNAVDSWSVGCVIAEMVLLEPIFPGDTSTDQLVEIIKVLGTPNRRQIAQMNPLYTQYKFPFIKCYTWIEVFKSKKEVPEEFIDLLSKLLIYEPCKRISPLEALLHPFFDELRIQNLNNGNPSASNEFHTLASKTPDVPDNLKNIILPNNLFNFSTEECSSSEKRNIIKKLIPTWYVAENNIKSLK